MFAGRALMILTKSLTDLFMFVDIVVSMYTIGIVFIDLKEDGKRRCCINLTGQCGDSVVFYHKHDCYPTLTQQSLSCGFSHEHLAVTWCCNSTEETSDFYF